MIKYQFNVRKLAILAVFALSGQAASAQSIPNLPGPSGAVSRPSTTRPLPPGANVPAPLPLPVTGIQDENYRLGSGDKLKLVVYGEADLGGEYLVGGTGEVQLPLLGQIPAAGMTLRDFQTAVGQKFVAEGYLKDPRISVEVLNYRPFYIIGEVKTPGQYPYIAGMNALNAVALAGGFTYRADERTVYVRRNGGATEVRSPADQTTKINPGDIVRIDERVF